MQLELSKNRIQSIDVLRGLVMVIMALDHVRDYFYKVDLTKAADAAMDPTNMQTTFPMLFFTRWITHFCAPIFIFLAGTSIYLMSKKMTKNELSIFLFKRGLFLVILEVTVITLGWTFNPLFSVFILQVIWAIGISMILLGLVVQLPYRAILFLGLLIVVGHNILDFPFAQSLRGNVFANLAYFTNFSFYALDQSHFVIVVYAFLPWTGVMMLGYCFGKLYEKDVDVAYRRKLLLQLGASILIVFVVLRFSNLYGDPMPWSSQPRGTVYTFLSFLNLNKYPPSLLFICMTIGPAMIFLALIEKIQNRFTDIMNVYGKVPMLYYILHFYFIHLTLIVVFFAQGFGEKDIVSQNNPFLFKPNGIGFGLFGTYVVWIFIVVLLYPICKKYGEYRSRTKQWWHSYL
ncbi:MAG: heparan-alpha-glucosaminide N-acetyltransferase domain-containing protein [Cyclobacteriaceae bacterium]